jgi:hypothetical protein
MIYSVERASFRCEISGLQVWQIILIPLLWLLYLKTAAFENHSLYIIVCRKYKDKSLVINMMQYFDVRPANLLSCFIIDDLMGSVTFLCGFQIIVL